MQRFLPRSVLAIGALALAACAEDPSTADESQGLGLAKTGRFLSAEIIVKTDRKIDADGPVEIAGRHFTPVRQMLSGAWLLHLDEADAALAADDTDATAELRDDAIAALEAEPDIVWATPNYPADFQIFPTDPLFIDQQWHYDSIRLQQAWDITTGGAVRIAVIDTGSLPHPELVNRWAGGRDFMDGDFNPTDDGLMSSQGILWWRHGIHVAGIIGATTNEFPGRGSAGVCWNCPLVPVRIGDVSTIDDAIMWAANPSFNPTVGGASRVLNLSLVVTAQGGAQLTCDQVPSLRDAMAYAASQNVVVVESAGNYARTRVEAPSDCPGVIAVAASQPSRALADYSNRGTGVDLVAPGGGGSGNTQYGPGISCPADGGPYNGAQGAVSTWASSIPTNQLTPANYCWRNLSGTSMSAPHVAGVVGLMLTVRPQLTPAQVTQILTATATLDPARITCAAGQCGAGLLDAHLAVKYALNGGVPTAVMAPVGFGNVAVTTAAVVTGVLSNGGTGPLTLGPQPVLRLEGGGGQLEFAFADGGGCASGTTCNRAFAAVAAGGTMNIPLRCRPTAVGAIAANLIIQSNALAASTTVTVTCNGTPPPVPDITVAPLALAFGSVRVGTTTAEQIVTVVNNGAAGTVLNLTATRPSAEFGLACTGACSCSAGTCSASLAVGGSIQLRVNFTPAGLGPRGGPLTISSNDPDENPTLVGLSGTGVLPAASLLPALIDVSTTPGTPVTGTFTLASSGTMALTTSTWSIIGPIAGGFAFASGPCAGATTCNSPIGPMAPPTSVAIPVRCNPTAAGVYLAKLSITHDGVGSPTIAELRCTAVPPPQVLISTAPGLLFGNVPLGETRSAQIWVANTTGNDGSVLTFTASQSSSQYHLECNHACTCADDICTAQVGGSAAGLILSYTPTVVGPESSNITFVTNDPVNPFVTLLSTGTGVSAQVTVLEPSGGGALYFSTPIGITSTAETITLSNTGTQPLHIDSAGFTGLAGYAFTIEAGSPGPQTIAPGDQVSWAVACHPDWFGGKKASFRVEHDAPTAGSFTGIGLKCNGTYDIIEPPWFPPPWESE